MVMVVTNPGTEGRSGTSVENATAIATRICEDLTIPNSSVMREPRLDSAGGLYGFIFPGNLEVQIPGDDPDEVCLSQPFKSRRLYVDGSSWLYGYAVGIIESRLQKGKS